MVGRDVADLTGLTYKSWEAEMIHLITTLGLVLFLGACSDNKSAPANADRESNSSSKASLASNENTHVLTQTPISIADALGLTSTIIETAPCPFLSDQTVLKSINTSFKFERREVSNSLCRWSYNAGFSVIATIEPLVSAQPISERSYNIDIDPVLSAQDGPGENANILSDTAWDKPLPYAYSFEKDSKLVFIKYTGVHTRVDKMREAAEEVANRMTNAKTIEHQRREAANPYKPCETWTTLEILSAFGFADDSTVRSSAGSGLTSCQWKIRESGKLGERMLSIRFVKQEAGKPFKLTGYREKSDDDVTYNIKTEESDFGHYVKMITYIDGGYLEMTLLNQNTALPDVAKVLNANVIGRLTP